MAKPALRGLSALDFPPLVAQLAFMKILDRITLNPDVMGGRACIRGLRVTAGTIAGLVATGHASAEILKLYPYLEIEDIAQALKYAAWRAEEVELPLQPA